MDEELQRRVRDLEQKLSQMRDEIEARRRKDTYTMASLGKQNLQNNVTMDLMLAQNLVWNSSFEMPKSGVQPAYWTAGVSSTEQAFIGMVSLKLAPSQVSAQTSDAYIPTAAFGGEQIRVTFAQYGGTLRCEVIDQSGTVMLSHDFNPTDSWYNGRRTFTLKPGLATSVHLRFTNVDTTNPVYIDAVQIEPDVLRKWPSLYFDGPKSGAYASEAIGGFALGLSAVAVAMKTAGLTVTSTDDLTASIVGAISAVATVALNNRIELAYTEAVNWYLGAVISDILNLFQATAIENATSGDIADPLIGTIETSAVVELNPPS